MVPSSVMIAPDAPTHRTRCAVGADVSKNDSRPGTWRPANHLVTLAAAALAIAGTGCQSGHIGFHQFSTNGKVIAFEDSEYNKLYVADASGVKPLDKSGDFLLSPDGAWILMIRRQGRAPNLAYRAGDELLLLDWRSGRNYTMLLPFNIPQNLIEEPGNRVPRSVEKIRDPALLAKAKRARVFFLGDIEIIIGPIWDEYFHWGSAAKPDDRWTRLSAKEVKNVLPPLSASRRISEASWGTAEPCLVEVPSDGWTALHTTWVRPGGSTLELLRKNDAPLTILAACGGTIIAPVFAFAGTVHLMVSQPSFEMNQLMSRILLPFDSTLFYWVFLWDHATHEIYIDREKLMMARDMLQQEIKKRSAVSSKPTPAGATQR